MGNDFATPALYFFSTVAQTMGAILGIVLAALYAIFPLIQQRNNQPSSDLLMRFLRRDSYLQNALKCGFLSILFSVISILTLYIFGNTNIISLVNLFIIVIPIICLGVISCYNIIFFVINKLSIYCNIQRLYNDISFYSIDFTKLCSSSKHDYLELIMLINSMLCTEFGISKYNIMLFKYDYNIDIDKFLKDVYNDISLSTKEDNLYHLSHIIPTIMVFVSKHAYRNFNKAYISSSILNQFYVILKKYVDEKIINKSIEDLINHYVNNDLVSLIRNDSLTDSDRAKILNEIPSIFTDLMWFTQNDFRLNLHIIERMNTIMFEIIERFHNNINYTNLIENYIRFSILSLFYHYKDDSRRDPHQYERVISGYLDYLKRIVIIDNKYINSIAFFTYYFSDNFFELNTLLAFYYFISQIPPDNSFLYIGSNEYYSLTKFSVFLFMSEFCEVGEYTKEDTSHTHNMRIIKNYFNKWQNLKISERVMPEFTKVE